ncbi:MAG: FAD-binding oxidoreductase [Pseudomonadota bacterium]
MSLPTEAPAHSSYDVVIIGGAMMGSSTAWWLSRNPDFDGRILVVERDPTYEFAATSLTNSCIRQQFSSEINVQISQFGAEFIHEFKDFMQDEEAPEILLRSFGYLYLAGDQAMADTLIASQKVQESLGSATRILSAEEIVKKWPFYNPDGILLGSHNPVDEGYFDGGTIFHWFRKKAREQGVEYIGNEVAAIDSSNGSVSAIHLKSGEKVEAANIVNSSGTRGPKMAAMIGAELPIEPRRRYTYIFTIEEPLGQDLPLTIDPSGCHMRWDGANFLAGCPPFDDHPMDVEDFAYEDEIWEEKLWPALANRVPVFERVRVLNSWVGHYDYNMLDYNAIIGPHPDIPNFFFMNGYSGHGLQQSPAMGRAMSELLTYGEYKSIDMSPMGYERVLTKTPLVEKAVI